MNNCQIQKLIILCLGFSNIYITPGVANPLHQGKSFFINKISENNVYKENNTVIDLKNYWINKPLIITEDIQVLSYENSNNQSIEEKINYVANELFIESKVQSEKKNILYADGEVIVKYKGNILKADSLIYDKKAKLAKAEGNIQLQFNNQIFQADMVEYDFVKKKGNFKNVKGLINFESIVSDFDFSSNAIYKEFLTTIKKIKKDTAIFTPDKVTNWIFSTELLTVDQNKWLSKKAFLTNDLIETNQIKLQFNELQVSSFKEKLQLKSKINYLIFQDKITIPFWFGDRTIFKNPDNTYAFAYQNRWNIGYDKLNKDGYFIGRKLNSIKIKDDLFLTIEPQFLLQRTLKGKTKSFVQKHYSLNSPRFERNISLSDYFALSSSLNGKIKDWDLKIMKELNSFDFDKFANALRTKAELSKEINLFNTFFVNRLFGAYRERIWNGSIGESEIFNAYGWRLDKANSWKNGAIEKNQIITFGFGNYKAEKLNTNDLVESYKGSFTYQLNQRIPVHEKKIDSEYIDKSFEYIPEPIKQGVFMNSQISLNYASYKDGFSQKYFGVSLGPEVVVGNFKNNFFDYTRISAAPFYKFKSGNSVFKFDQVADKFTVDLNFDQHLIGSLLLQTQSTINLDKDSDDYGKFIYSSIGLNFKKRSYNLGIFYQPHNQAGGINFSLNGFK